MLDTIAALATPPGRGGIGVIRISGIKTKEISKAILGLLPKPRTANYLSFLDENNTIIDKGIAIYFTAPHSLTGEDVLELQGHGGPIVLDYLLKRILNLGVRMARPGEFSERAFLNGKIDLTQAEAVADLINANSIQAVRSAARSMQGVFSESINQLLFLLIDLRMHVEAMIDFPEEEIDFLKSSGVDKKLNHILTQLEKSFSSAKQGALLREGITVVIAGAPNVGKSSLLNQLTGHDSAIVSNIPGTTRDILREPIHIDGLPLHLIDTAGIRETHDPIEKEGMRRAHNEIEKADRVLLIRDISNHDFSENLINHDKITVIYNKIDLVDKRAYVEKLNNRYSIYLSARTGDGMDLLREHLKSIVGYDSTQEGVFIARRRHIDILERVQKYLQQACAYIKSSEPCSEFLAEELRLAQNALSEITGEFRADDLLGEIFSSFCIGK